MDMTGLGSAFDFARGVMDKFFPPDATPEQKMAMQSALEQSVKSRDAAKGQIIVAEMQQGDNFTKRARPMVVYAGLVMIAINYVAFPFLGRLVALSAILFTDAGIIPATITPVLEPLPLPIEFWTAWGGVVSIWVLGRSAEKRGSGGNFGKIASLITGGKK